MIRLIKESIQLNVQNDSDLTIFTTTILFLLNTGVVCFPCDSLKPRPADICISRFGHQSNSRGPTDRNWHNTQTLSTKFVVCQQSHVKTRSGVFRIVLIKYLCQLHVAKFPYVYKNISKVIIFSRY